MGGPFPISGGKGQGDQAVEQLLPTETLKLLKKQIDSLDNDSIKSNKSNARTCSDIYVSRKESGSGIISGNYFIDPNSGSEADSFEVYCNFDSEKVQTCVYPTKESGTYNSNYSSINYLEENIHPDN